MEETAARTVVDWQSVPQGARWYWVLTKHPSDHPNHYVVRGHVLHEAYGPHGVPTNHATLYDDYETAHADLAKGGMTCMPHRAGWDPVIVELWF